MLRQECLKPLHSVIREKYCVFWFFETLRLSIIRSNFGFLQKNGRPILPLTFEHPDFWTNFHFYRTFEKSNSTEAVENSWFFCMYFKKLEILLDRIQFLSYLATLNILPSSLLQTDKLKIFFFVLPDQESTISTNQHNIFMSGQT